jgi:hypothetical protein
MLVEVVIVQRTIVRLVGFTGGFFIVGLVTTKWQIDCRQFQLNGKLLEAAGRCNVMENRVSDGNAARGSNAAMIKMTKMIEQVFRKHQIQQPCSRMPKQTSA